MDSEETLNALEKYDVICSGKGDNLDCSSIMNGKADFPQTISEMVEDTDRASLVPLTPDIGGECRDRGPHLVLNSPVTLPSILLEKSCLDSATVLIGDGDSPRTPKGEIFDPFAPGSDELLLAPRCKKHLDEWRINVARCLDFGSCTKNPEARNQNKNGADQSLSDEEMVESVYENLLETILSHKIKDVLAEMATIEWDDDACKTPTSVPRLTGIAETCPPAPMKATARSRNIDSSLCRKLEF